MYKLLQQNFHYLITNNYLFYLNNIYIVMLSSISSSFFGTKSTAQAPAPVGPEVQGTTALGPGPEGTPPGPELPQVTTEPVPGFPTTNPENRPRAVTTEPVSEFTTTNLENNPINPPLEMPTNPIGLANVEPGQLVKLDTNKYIVKIVTMGATGNVYELIDLGNATPPLTNKKLTDFQFDNTNPQQNALDIATSPLLGYSEFTGTGKISDILKNIDPKVQSYFVIDKSGNATNVKWNFIPYNYEFYPNNKYIYRSTSIGPTADGIKEGKYTTPDKLIKTEKKSWFGKNHKK